jgi:hypothetical protein
MFRATLCSSTAESMYPYDLWYMSFCVGDRLVCRPGRFLPDLHTRRSPTQSDIYQMSYWYSWFSWWWARGCSKHVENWNKCTEKRIVRKLVVYKNFQGRFQVPSACVSSTSSSHGDGYARSCILYRDRPATDYQDTRSDSQEDDIKAPASYVQDTTKSPLRWTPRLPFQLIFYTPNHSLHMHLAFNNIVYAFNDYVFMFWCFGHKKWRLLFLIIIWVAFYNGGRFSVR